MRGRNHGDFDDSLETRDKNGHWFREWRTRSPSVWVIVEQWAHDCGYRLVGLKGSRRLYARRIFGAVFWVEFRKKPETVRVSGWLTLGFWSRAARLFKVDEMHPVGVPFFLGKRTNQTALRDLSLFLSRVGESPIAGAFRIGLSDLGLHSFLILTASLGILSATLWVAMANSGVPSMWGAEVTLTWGTTLLAMMAVFSVEVLLLYLLDARLRVLGGRPKWKWVGQTMSVALVVTAAVWSYQTLPNRLQLGWVKQACFSTHSTNRAANQCRMALDRLPSDARKDVLARWRSSMGSKGGSNTLRDSAR